MVYLAGARRGGEKVAAMSGSISEYFSRLTEAQTFIDVIE